MTHTVNALKLDKELASSVVDARAAHPLLNEAEVRLKRRKKQLD